jgi:hypothetical protein
MFHLLIWIRMIVESIIINAGAGTITTQTWTSPIDGLLRLWLTLAMNASQTDTGYVWICASPVTTVAGIFPRSTLAVAIATVYQPSVGQAFGHSHSQFFDLDFPISRGQPLCVQAYAITASTSAIATFQVREVQPSTWSSLLLR